uniref:Uncharacterized protein n=1 Tax=Anopheles arabiensis TaxID=7173 RepID=A0A182IG19_ANOAR
SRRTEKTTRLETVARAHSIPSPIADRTDRRPSLPWSRSPCQARGVRVTRPSSASTDAGFVRIAKFWPEPARSCSPKRRFFRSCASCLSSVLRVKIHEKDDLFQVTNKKDNVVF